MLRSAGSPPSQAPWRTLLGRSCAACLHTAPNCPRPMYDGKKMRLFKVVSQSVHRPACSQCAMPPQLSSQRVHLCITLCFKGAPRRAGWRSEARAAGSHTTNYPQPVRVNFFNEFLKRKLLQGTLARGKMQSQMMEHPSRFFFFFCLPTFLWYCGCSLVELG